MAPPFAVAEQTDYDRFVLRGTGVLVNAVGGDEDFVALEGKVVIGASGGGVYATLDFSRQEMAFRYTRMGTRATPRIRALHTDFNVLIMDARPTRDGRFEAFVDGEWRPVLETANLTYFSWPDFLRERGEFTAKEGTRLVMYANRGMGSGRMLNGDYAFKVISVEGDWVYAECDRECDGCGPRGRKFRGWFRWRVANTLMIDLRYIC